MASWSSIPLEITYEVLGWLAFISWSISFYPQVILNFRRKSVIGLNFDFVLLNLTKHSSYLIYNATLYFSSAIQKQYLKKAATVGFVSALDESVVKSVFEKAFQSLPDISKAVSDLTVLKGMGQATASDNTTTPLLPESSPVGSETHRGMK
ncbi:hypothetical protein M0R45_015656 [Rubus argutus]|uniref:Uncharacterized protein n=1 Tax=Rubus argutus TaxID=59490 RepID=A0AAW1XQA3_RUBAR